MEPKIATGGKLPGRVFAARPTNAMACPIRMRSTGCRTSGRGSSVVLAVADGHGSARYSRSHIGAMFAVERSAQLIDEFLNSQSNVDNLSLIKHATEEWLPRALVRNWTEAVNEHLKSDPLTPDELSRWARSRRLLMARRCWLPPLPSGLLSICNLETERFSR